MATTAAAAAAAAATTTSTTNVSKSITSTHRVKRKMATVTTLPSGQKRQRPPLMLSLVVLMCSMVLGTTTAWRHGGGASSHPFSVTTKNTLATSSSLDRRRAGGGSSSSWLLSKHKDIRRLSATLDGLRGGAAAAASVQQEDSDEESDDDEDKEPSSSEALADTTSSSSAASTTAPTSSQKEPAALTIRTALGNELIDQVLELPNVQRSRTIGSLKESLRRQLPGKPPVSSMQLLLDGRQILSDDMTIDELLDDEDDDDEDEDENDETKSSSSLLTLTLDMIPPVDPKFMTQVESRLADMTTSDLLQAFCVNEAALFRNAALLEEEYKKVMSLQQQTKEGHVDDDDEEESSPSSLPTTSSSSNYLYLELRQEAERIRSDMEQTILATEAARQLLADEEPPSAKKRGIEIRGQRIRRPLQGGRTTRVKEQIQRNLNVSWADTLRYCVLFLFFGYFGGRTPVSRAILFLGAPSVFVLQARPVKLWLKQILYTLLDHPPGIFLSLLPAPQQTILNFDYAESMRLLYGTHAVETQQQQSSSLSLDEEDEDAGSEEDDYDSDEE